GDLLTVVAVPRATPADGDTVTALRVRLRERREGHESTHAAERSVLAAKAGSLAARLAATREEMEQIEDESATRRQRLAIARDMLGQLERLRLEGHVSELQARQQESAALELLGELQLLERQATAARRTIAQLQQARLEVSAQVEAAAAVLRRDLALLGQEQV